MSVSTIIRRIEAVKNLREKTSLLDPLNGGNFRMRITRDNRSLSPNDGSSSEIHQILLIRNWQISEVLLSSKEISGHTTQNIMWGIEGSYYSNSEGDIFDPDEETYQVSFYEEFANINHNKVVNILTNKGWIELTLASSDWDAKEKIEYSESIMEELSLEDTLQAILNLV